MGRKAATPLNVAVTSMPGQRPPPPEYLNPEQSAVWRSVVSCLPHDWFSPDNIPLLVEYCRHVDRANRLDDTAQKLMSVVPWSDEVKDVLTAAKKESECIIGLARQMRLSQNSRFVTDRAAVAANKAVKAAEKPWDRYKTEAA